MISSNIYSLLETTSLIDEEYEDNIERKENEQINKTITIDDFIQNDFINSPSRIIKKKINRCGRQTVSIGMKNTTLMYYFSRISKNQIVSKYKTFRHEHNILFSTYMYRGFISMVESIIQNISTEELRDLCVLCPYYSNTKDIQVGVTGKVVKRDPLYSAYKELIEEVGIYTKFEQIELFNRCYDDTSRLISNYGVNITKMDNYDDKVRAATQDDIDIIYNNKGDDYKHKIQVIIYGTYKDVRKLLPSINYRSKANDNKKIIGIRIISLIDIYNIIRDPNLYIFMRDGYDKKVV